MAIRQLHNEKELLLASSQGNQQAFTELFRAYQLGVAQYIHRFTQSTAETQDIVQDVFIKIWLQRTELASVNNFNGWLFTLCRNHTLNILKKRLRTIERERSWAQQFEGEVQAPVPLSEGEQYRTGIEHNYDFAGNLYDDVKQFMTLSKTWMTPTLQVTRNGAVGGDGERYFYKHYHPQHDPKVRHFLSDEYIAYDHDGGKLGDTISNYPYLLGASASMTGLRNRGAHITMGSHGNFVGIGAHYEIWALKFGGMTNHIFICRFPDLH